MKLKRSQGTNSHKPYSHQKLDVRNAESFKHLIGPSRKVSLIVIIIVCSLFAVSSAGELLERRFGLPSLFGLRNAFAPPVVPNDLFIVTPYKISSSDKPSLLRKWDRRVHAKAIDQLSSLGVSVLAIDIFFRDPHPGEDEHLAQALGSIPDTLLVQNVRPVGGALNAGTLESPVLEIATAASRLALSQIPGTAVRNDYYALRAPILIEEEVEKCHSMSDQQRGCPISTDPPAGAIDSIRSDKSALKYRYKTAPTLPLAAFELWSIKNKSTEPSISQKLSKPKPSRKIPVTEVSHLHLNLYGPPKTIPTLDYTDIGLLADSLVDGLSDNPLSGSVVFLGGSYDALHDQRDDGFLTVFSSNDRPMPGVEMAATAFANLRDDNALTSRTQPRWMLSLTLLSVLPLVFFSRSVRTRRSLVLAGLSAVTLLIFVSYQFASAHVWLPFITPLLALACATTGVILSDLHINKKLKDKARGELGTFVSDLVLAQLDGEVQRKLSQSVCLVSDVRGFTAMSEKLSAEALHEYNEHYFSVLFDRVSFYGADVVKTYGDSMTAIWVGASPAERTKAMRASRDIVLHMNMQKSNEDPPLTHIGISSGPVVVGYVGGGQRRSVELTGGAVYRASRLEQLNKHLGTMILASEEFEPQAIKTGMNVKDAGSRQLRGFSNAIRVISIEPCVVEKFECASV